MLSPALLWLESEEVWPASELTEERDQTRELGYMLHDIDYARGMQPRFFRASLTDGVLHVPAWDREEVRK